MPAVLNEPGSFMLLTFISSQSLPLPTGEVARPIHFSLLHLKGNAGVPNSYVSLQPGSLIESEEGRGKKKKRREGKMTITVLKNKNLCFVVVLEIDRYNKKKPIS